MPSRPPVTWLLVLLAPVVCAIVNPGNFGTIDTTRRLQEERWIRLGEPPVRRVDAASGFGLVGRNGVAHPWYGMGQSLVLLPFDTVVSAAAPLLQRFRLDAERQRQVTELAIAFLMQAMLTAAMLLLARAVLVTFDFSPFAATAGALSLLLATTALAYVQCAQENELLLVLALAALLAIRRWERTGNLRWAAGAGVVGGFAVLVRLPSLLECAVFAAFALFARGDRKRFLAAYLPGLIAGLLLDRWYQWLRFGEWFSTYMGIIGRLPHPPGMPASYPFSYPFFKGFFGAFLSLDKSVVLFDPLLIVVALAAAWQWQELDRRLRAALLSLAGLLLLYVTFFARYYGFGGDSAWGHRFLTLPVQLLALFAVPLLLKTGSTLPGAIRRGGWVVVVFAVALQALSTTMSSNVEVTQRDAGSVHSVIFNRVVNLADAVAGRYDDPRFVDIPQEWRTFAYFPFQLRFRFPGLANWAIAAWLLLLISAPILVRTILSGAAPASPARSPTPGSTQSPS